MTDTELDLLLARNKYHRAWILFMRARGIANILASWWVGVTYARMVRARNFIK